MPSLIGTPLRGGVRSYYASGAQFLRAENHQYEGYRGTAGDPITPRKGLPDGKRRCPGGLFPRSLFWRLTRGGILMKMKTWTAIGFVLAAATLVGAQHRHDGGQGSEPHRAAQRCQQQFEQVIGNRRAR